MYRINMSFESPAKENFTIDEGGNESKLDFDEQTFAETVDRNAIDDFVKNILRVEELEESREDGYKTYREKENYPNEINIVRSHLINTAVRWQMSDQAPNMDVIKEYLAREYPQAEKAMDHFFTAECQSGINSTAMSVRRRLNLFRQHTNQERVPPAELEGVSILFNDMIDANHKIDYVMVWEQKNQEVGRNFRLDLVQVKSSNMDDREREAVAQNHAAFIKKLNHQPGAAKIFEKEKEAIKNTIGNIIYQYALEGLERKGSEKENVKELINAVGVSARFDMSVYDLDEIQESKELRAVYSELVLNKLEQFLSISAEENKSKDRVTDLVDDVVGEFEEDVDDIQSFRRDMIELLDSFSHYLNDNYRREEEYKVRSLIESVDKKNRIQHYEGADRSQLNEVDLDVDKKIIAMYGLDSQKLFSQVKI